MISETALRWLRLIEDSHGWMSEDEQESGARPGDPPICCIPWIWRRHLVLRGLVEEVVYHDGSWRLDATPLGRLIRRDPVAAHAADPRLPRRGASIASRRRSA